MPDIKPDPVVPHVVTPIKPPVAPVPDDEVVAELPGITVPGGRYVRKAILKGGKHYGGEIVNAHGDILATFKPGQINTGRPEDGTPPVKE